MSRAYLSSRLFQFEVKANLIKFIKYIKKIHPLQQKPTDDFTEWYIWSQLVRYKLYSKIALTMLSYFQYITNLSREACLSLKTVLSDKKVNFQSFSDRKGLSHAGLRLPKEEVLRLNTFQSFTIIRRKTADSFRMEFQPSRTPKHVCIVDSQNMNGASFVDVFFIDCRLRNDSDRLEVIFTGLKKFFFLFKSSLSGLNSVVIVVIDIFDRIFLSKIRKIFSSVRGVDSKCESSNLHEQASNLNDFSRNRGYDIQSHNVLIIAADGLYRERQNRFDKISFLEPDYLSASICCCPGFSQCHDIKDCRKTIQFTK